MLTQQHNYNYIQFIHKHETYLRIQSQVARSIHCQHKIRVTLDQFIAQQIIFFYLIPLNCRRDQSKIQLLLQTKQSGYLTMSKTKQQRNETTAQQNLLFPSSHVSLVKKYCVAATPIFCAKLFRPLRMRICAQNTSTFPDRRLYSMPRPTLPSDCDPV